MILQMLPVRVGDVLAGLDPWQGFVLIGLLSLGVARLVQVGGDAALRRLTARIPGRVDDIVLNGVHPPLYLTVLFVGVYLGTLSFDIGVAADRQLRAGLITLLAVVWVVSLVRIGRAVSREARRNERLDKQLFPIFQNVWTALLLASGLFVVLSVWRIDVTPLLASAGIAGIVVGLAARDSIANFFGSIALYADGTYRVGDYVVLDSGERGVVEDVTIRSTVLRTRDDVLVTVPNAVLNNATVINETEPVDQYRISTTVGVAYGSDLDTVETELLAATAANDDVLEDPEPRARLRSFGDSALQYELLCWVPDPGDRGRVTHEVNREICDRFDEASIEIPYPQREMGLKNTRVAMNSDTGSGRQEHPSGGSSAER
jgi:small-conductance mechanosensitive channel